MDRKIRIWISGVGSSRLAVYELAVPVEEAVLSNFDRGFPQPGFETKGGEFTHRVGKEGNSNAERFYFRNTFVNAAGKSSLLQGESKAQTADSAANDDDVHSSIVKPARGNT
jgi:hypothetical protein